MDDRAKKAHRPAQSGGKADKKKDKGKEKANHEKGFNEKVIIYYFLGLPSLLTTFTCPGFRT